MKQKIYTEQTHPYYRLCSFYEVVFEWYVLQTLESKENPLPCADDFHHLPQP